MAPRKLRIGIAGLGRMGSRHALHFLNHTPRAELVAASTPDDTELQWAKTHLEPYGVTLYKSYDDMLRHDDLQAVVIASVTAVHAEQAIKAIDLDKHVLCEKPLSTSVAVVSRPLLFTMQMSLQKLTCTNQCKTVPNSHRRRKAQTSPKSYVRLLPPFRRLLPRRLRKSRLRHYWPALHLPQPDM